ncbi:hypothetical protein EMMF5_005035 [Cystobasidiomycetes sp. EMM_F5]
MSTSAKTPSREDAKRMLDADISSPDVFAICSEFYMKFPSDDARSQTLRFIALCALYEAAHVQRRPDYAGTIMEEIQAIYDYVPDGRSRTKCMQLVNDLASGVHKRSYDFHGEPASVESDMPTAADSSEQYFRLSMIRALAYAL